MIALAPCRVTYPEWEQASERNPHDRLGFERKKIYSHIAKRMTAASELQVTRVTSNPRYLFSRVQFTHKKGFGGPVATLSRVTMAIDGRIALMTSREAFDGVTVARGGEGIVRFLGSAPLSITGDKSELTVR